MMMKSQNNSLPNWELLQNLKAIKGGFYPWIDREDQEPKP